MSAKEKNQLVCLGAIVGVHGIRGEVKVKSWTDVDDRIDSYGPLTDKNGSESFVLRVVGHAKELLRCKIKGVDDRNTAEALIGTGLYVDRSALPERTEAEEYYQADLIGLDVLSDADRTKIATLVGIYNFGAGDILEIKLLSTSQTEMIPFTRDYVPEVSPSQGYITVRSTTMNFATEDSDDAEG